MTKYGILDDRGRVIRWVYEKPSDQYQYIVVTIKKPRKPKVDLSQYEEARW